MPSDPSMITAQNRAYWEALAPHRLGEPVAFFAAGGSALNADELAAVGDVAGRRVLQLACAVGDEALTFARMGAEVTAVDLAPSHLATGRAKAAALGVEVDFREQDLMRLDPELTGFDLVYLSYGAICWVPDLTSWARDVAQRLRSGGALVISEHHPLWEVLTVAGADALTVTGDYLDPAGDHSGDPLKAPEVTRTLGQPDLPHQSFVWSLGAVVGAVLDAGLTVRSLREDGDPEMYPGLGEAAGRIPATYLLRAIR